MVVDLASQFAQKQEEFLPPKGALASMSLGLFSSFLVVAGILMEVTAVISSQSFGEILGMTISNSCVKSIDVY